MPVPSEYRSDVTDLYMRVHVIVNSNDPKEVERIMYKKAEMILAELPPEGINHAEVLDWSK